MELAWGWAAAFGFVSGLPYMALASSELYFNYLVPAMKDADCIQVPRGVNSAFSPFRFITRVAPHTVSTR